MGNVKKSINFKVYGFYNFVLAAFISVYPAIIQKSFFYGYCYMFIVSSFSSLHIANMNRKNLSSAHDSEDSQTDKYGLKKTETKSFPYFKVLTAILSVCIYYTVSVFFGAPLFSESSSTLYFSCLMTLLTVYPLIWYCSLSSDGVSGVFRMFADLKYDNLSECHLHMIVNTTLIGAWLGAFPIPLDWDRDWQEWPMTCCIGASLGYCAAHVFIGLKVMHSFYTERRKLSWNLFV